MFFDDFKMRAEAVQAEVHRVADKAAALALIEEILTTEGVKDAPGETALWADCPFLEGVDKNALVAKHPGLSFEVTRLGAKDSKIGITQATYGLARTGSLVCDSTGIEGRLASMLPVIHIGIIETDKILPDMPTVFSKLTPAQSSYISLISGPSRTADIERVLTIGVHGPKRLIVVCVDAL